WDSLGEVHMGLGNHDEAIRCFEKTLELNPSNNSARQMLARVRADSEKK
ncbi:MAG: tetratricopeptide repeat protein, partial [Deltaproteobacteria bacterium]|nr:tetratricopeptide repeat protein [Deltaproteobacteria bacterium]